MKKLGIVMGIALALTATTVVINPTNTEAKSKKVTYVSTKQAGKKIVALQKKAYKSKKKVSTTFKFKAKSENRAGDFVEKAFNEAAKIQYGTAYRKGIRATSDTYESWNSEAGSKFNKKTKVFTYKFTINGKSKKYRTAYRNDECRRKLINEVTSLTKGKNQFDKAWITMVWLQNRAWYWGGKNQRTTDYDLYKRKFGTDCDGLADAYAYYAVCAGVKKVGTVVYDNHMWNWIKVGGKRYYIDFQGALNYCEHDKDIKKAIKLSCNPVANGRWDDLVCLKMWCSKNNVADVESLDTCKAVWDKMTVEQQKAFRKVYLGEKDYPDFEYSLKCSSYSQYNFRPVDAFCETDGQSCPEYWKHKVYTLW